MDKFTSAMSSSSLSSLLRMRANINLQKPISTEVKNDSYDNIPLQIIELMQRKIYNRGAPTAHAHSKDIEGFFLGSTKRSWSTENSKGVRKSKLSPRVDL